MMGRHTSDQGKLFYAFDLDMIVPTDHLLRGIDAVLDLSELHQYLATYYSHTGRSSIDPELMMRMLIVGYSFGSFATPNGVEPGQTYVPPTMVDGEIVPGHFE